MAGSVAAVTVCRRTARDDLDASAFRAGHHYARGLRLAAGLDLPAAVAQLELALPFLGRSSPGTTLTLLAHLAWFSVLRGDRATAERAARIASGPRDWGPMLSAPAEALEHLAGLLDGDVTWDAVTVPIPSYWFGGEVPGLLSGLHWVLVDAWAQARVDHLGLGHSGQDGQPGPGFQQVTSHVVNGRWAFRSGRFHDAEPHLFEMVRRPAPDRHFWLLMLARCAAEGDSHVEAARLLGAVEATQERFGLPWLPRFLVAARDETERAGREATGQETFAAARAEGRRLDLDDAVAYALRARGERKRPSSGWASLTPTERQVVEQVAAGRSNTEIAQQLLMGRTTVKTHLAHIFTKLGVTSRVELAAQAARRDARTDGLDASS